MTAESTTKIILSKAEDWKKWFCQLKGHVDSDIWTYLDPNVDKEDKKELIKKFVKSYLQHYNYNTMIFANLLQAQQKTFESAKQLYNYKLKEYNYQHDLLRETRTYI